MSICVKVLVWMYIFTSVEYILEGPAVALCLITGGAASFSKAAAPFGIPTRCVRGAVSPHACQHLSLSLFLFIHRNGCEVGAHRRSDGHLSDA